MGAQQSTRKLTLDNDDPANVIKVSDAVVDRLKGNREGSRNRGASTSSAIPVNPIQSVGVPVNPTYPQFLYEPTQTSLHFRQEKEIALQKNDAYWQHRINQLEETHDKINKLMEQEYNEAVNEVQSGFTARSTERRKPACVDGKKAVMDCYRKHPSEPMRCAREVQAFADCVDKHRLELTDNRG